MKEERKDKKNPIKKGIIEIVISILVLVLDFIYFLVAYSVYEHYTAKLNEYLFWFVGILILCVLCFFDGILTILLALQKKKKEKKSKENKNNNDTIENK